ncbi:MAG: NUDIX domain-containing protein [Alphaproteobacteria bacterium]|nr:NUDIX domain-containing protein [Alphaproteobacteria bacterium]
MIIRYLSFVFVLILTLSSDLYAAKESAGILPMFDDGTVLMGKENRFSKNLKKTVSLWSDFGGAADRTDNGDIARTALREANEETANTLGLTYEQVVNSPFTIHQHPSGDSYRMYYVRVYGKKPLPTDFHKNAVKLGWKNVEKSEWKYVSAQQLLDAVNARSYAAILPGTGEEIFALTRLGLKKDTAQRALRYLIESVVPAAQTSAPKPVSSYEESVLSYQNYWKEFLQKMGDSFREYNRSTLSNDAILKALFPSLPEGEVPPLEVAKAKFSELAKGGRPYAKLFTPPESVGSSSMDRSYEDYFRGDFLQKMGDSFREYNRSTLSNGAILKVLFPSLREGQIPDREAAKAKFSELAKGERPYAKLFTPPESVGSSSESSSGSSSSSGQIPPSSSGAPIPVSRSESMGRSYEDYFREDFLQKMGDSFREYNRSTLSNGAILKVLFPSLREGEVPSLEVAKAKFSELAKGGRPYALLFNPPEE